MSWDTKQDVRTREAQIRNLAGVIQPWSTLEERMSVLSRNIEEAEARGAEEQRRKDAEEIKLRFRTTFSAVAVGDIIAFMHPRTERVKAFRPYTVIPNNPDKPYDLVRFSLHDDGTYLYQQNEQSWKDDGGYIIHSPANVATLEEKYASLEREARADKECARSREDLLRTEVAELQAALKRAEQWAGVAHTSCMGTGPKQALGETLNGLHQFLQAALTREGGV